MSIADSRPLPLVQILPWWPGALIAGLLAGLVMASVRFGWLGPSAQGGWLGDLLVALADWKMAACLWVVLTLFLGVVVDLLALRRWRREIETFDLAGPQAREAWTYCAYAESWRTLPERHDLHDVADAIERRRQKLSRRLTQGWLFKYYLLCFSMPLVGLVLGWFNLETMGGRLPLGELFRPLLLMTLGPLAVLTLALLVARQARHTLETWQEKALQIAAEEHRLPQADKVPQVAFSKNQLELSANDYVLATELVLSDKATQDVEAVIQIRNNNPRVVEPPEGKVVIPAGETTWRLEMALLVNPASFDRAPPNLELEITSPHNARVGNPARQVVRWRLDNGQGPSDGGNGGTGGQPWTPEDEYKQTWEPENEYGI